MALKKRSSRRRISKSVQDDMQQGPAKKFKNQTANVQGAMEQGGPGRKKQDRTVNAAMEQEG